jgi:hypothetical protein
MLKSEQRYSLDEKLRSVGHLQKAAHPDTGFIARDYQSLTKITPTLGASPF